MSHENITQYRINYLCRNEMKEVQDAIPFKCKVKDGKQLREGMVTGRKLDFPIVVFEVNGMSVSREISWPLAYRLLTIEGHSVIV